jgi:hypothetical protein
MSALGSVESPQGEWRQAMRRSSTTGKCFCPASTVTTTSSRTPGQPLTRVCGLVHGEPRGHLARGSKRGARLAFAPESVSRLPEITVAHTCHSPCRPRTELSGRTGAYEETLAHRMLRCDARFFPLTSPSPTVLLEDRDRPIGAIPSGETPASGVTAPRWAAPYLRGTL